jgi:4'-phosphopantetheinyl transferase
VDVMIGWARPGSAGPGLGLLDAGERARADTFVRAEDRHRFIAQHTLLRLLVGDLTGADPGRLDLGWRCPVCGGHDHGRPVVGTDASVRISSTRSGERVVVAVARGDEPIGIDVEPIMATGPGEVAFDEVGFDAVAFSPDERALVMSHPDHERAIARTAMWVRKEAVLKRTGVGLTTSPEDFDALASGDVLTDVDVGKDYRCALATAEPARVTVADATARLAGRATRF